MLKPKEITKLNKIKIKYSLIILALVFFFFTLCRVAPTYMKYYYKVTGQVIGYAKETRNSSYTVKFYPNTGTGSMADQPISYNVPTNLNTNTFTKTDYVFSGWNTEPDGSGTSYSDGQEINNTTEDVINLYAQWSQGVALIVGEPTPYYTLQAAINAAGTSSQKTIRVLTDISGENLTVAKNQNIIFDFQNHTISIASGPLLENNGTVFISNGNITSSATNAGVINNNSTGRMTISGGRIINTATKGKQAVYNDKGILEITGSAYLENASSTAAGSNKRAALQNVAGGTLSITGGTIVAKNFTGVANLGTMTSGTSTTSPVIQGFNNGVSSTTNFSFYDGIVKGKDGAFDNEAKITAWENGYDIAHGEETGTPTYKTAYLAVTNTVEFDPNEGTVSELTRRVESGKPIGTLPVPERTGFRFDGWFTMKNGGTQITSSTLVTADVEYYAHWTHLMVARIGETTYDTLQGAINAAPNNTETTIELINNTNEHIKVGVRKNIVLDINSYTISVANDGPVIENSGTLTILSGTISSTQETGTINNLTTGILKVRGGTISGKQRSAIYNTSGTVEISGGYLVSSAVDKPSATGLDRGTIHNLLGGTVTITGGKIESTAQHAITSDSTVIIGTKDGNINTSSPEIIGKKYGIYTLGTLNFYDGIIKGGTDTIDGTITEIEDDSREVDGTETISGETFATKTLEIIPEP